MAIAHKSLTVDGVEVLFVKWQDDDENPSLRIMAHINGIFAESEISFDDEPKRDNCYDTMAEFAATDFVRLTKSAAGQAE